MCSPVQVIRRVVAAKGRLRINRAWHLACQRARAQASARFACNRAYSSRIRKSRPSPRRSRVIVGATQTDSCRRYVNYFANSRIIGFRRQYGRVICFSGFRRPRLACGRSELHTRPRRAWRQGRRQAQRAKERFSNRLPHEDAEACIRVEDGPLRRIQTNLGRGRAIIAGPLLLARHDKRWRDSRCTVQRRRSRKPLPSWPRRWVAAGGSQVAIWEQRFATL